ncbi:NhaP-type Na+/H+ or K+/H+ antiporter [Crossiella equi]|uniref:NhaP-type Na+/H+ or K+/H+ antiporter n=1 Tax=Crossiella equi TaxID=130796 RepID=A0ABS5A6P4_9PSEU|nr:hypothetical protein [Crossiella equi]MBP2472267.1 NhaP-type Na+/H+ or K+/H+ antiporter [Crossiella equi]
MGGYPRILLACVQDERHRWYVVASTTTTVYTRHPIPVARPAKGLVREEVSCPACGTPLLLRVFSPGLTWRWRLYWLGAVLAGAAVAAFAIAGLVALDQADDTSSPGSMLLLFLTSVVGMGTLVVGGVFLRHEDGVRLPGFLGDERHRLRRW